MQLLLVMSENLNNNNYLAISESFYSVQGEGITTGHPAYFIRLKDCNLTCGATRELANKVREAGAGNTEPGSFKGDLHTSGAATWTCDSLPIWLFGEKKPFEYLVDKWSKDVMFTGETLLDRINCGQVHLIWTGGEPMLPKHQKCIASFLDYLNNEHHIYPYNEVETNGTQVISDRMLTSLHQINCSLKLSNSGLPKEVRINEAAIKTINSHYNSWYKFVISTEDDITEFISDVLEPYDIHMSNVLCMPGMDSRENFHERTQFVLEMAKKYGFTGLTRLHISAWDKTCSV